MSACALSANGTKSWKYSRKPGSTKESGSPPKSNRFLPALRPWAMPHLFTKFHQNPFVTFGHILYTRNHTHTRIQTFVHILLNFLIHKSGLDRLEYCRDLITQNIFRTRSPAVARMADRTAPYSRRSMQKLWCIHANRSSRFLVIGIARFTRIDPKCNQVVLSSLHTFPENFMQIGPAVSPEYKTSQTDDRQTTRCAIGATDSTVGQKLKIQNTYSVTYFLLLKCLIVKWFCCLHIHISFHLEKLLVIDEILCHTAFPRSFSVLSE